MAPVLSFLISSGSKKKETRFVCPSEAKASQLHQMWTEVSSSVPHFLQMGLLLSRIIYKCLVKVLCPVSRFNKTWVLSFLLADSPASESYVPTFRNTQFHLYGWCAHITYGYGTGCSETSAHKIQTLGNQSKERI